MRYKRQDTPVYEFRVHHQPFTVSSKGKASYREAVAKAAREKIDSPITSDDVEVDVIYSTATTQGLGYDVDNILKPTLDGLERVAYDNDRQVRSVCSTKYDATKKHLLEGNVEHIPELFYSAEPHVVLIRIFSDTELEKLGGGESVAKKRTEEVLARLDGLTGGIEGPIRVVKARRPRESVSRDSPGPSA